MKVLIQRVACASVTIEGRIAGRIGPGLLLFVGVERGDGDDEVEAAAEKVAGLRVFSDAQGRMNLDLGQVGGQALVVSQFTLAGSLRRGRRPSFDDAAPPAEARRLVDAFGRALAGRGVHVECGELGADMKVDLRNDGPVTFLLELPLASRRKG